MKTFPTTTSTISTISDQDLKDLKEAFSLFDKDGDGNITLHELGVVMRRLGHAPTDEELESMLNVIDIDSDGSIDFEEFATMMGEKMNQMDYDDEMKQVIILLPRVNLIVKLPYMVKYALLPTITTWIMMMKNKNTSVSQDTCLTIQFLA